MNFILNNCGNRVYSEHYNLENVVYDFSIGANNNHLFSSIMKGDEVVVLSYADINSRDSVVAVTYCVERLELTHDYYKAGRTSPPCGLVIGYELMKYTFLKFQAVVMFPEMFDKNGNFKRGVNIKEHA
ncbi:MULTISPECIES: hypothetical protein [unclassified Shewanella]|uniref:hypothetical protein n=1 Tax=unclassified Shewanella TaxID=196818 RepID=UPI0012FEB188|nr:MULTISPECIES: hypothetical protein [unclassified Shewanella]